MSEKIKTKVLVIDDEPGFTELVKFNLEFNDQYEVLVENNSSSAVRAAIQYQPDIILLDVIMPDREGPDILFELRNHPKLKNIPVVFLTATVRKGEADGGPSVPLGYTILAKPSTVKELIECIEKHVPRVS